MVFVGQGGNNVHSMWHYNEPGIVIDGQQYSFLEAYYHLQKPKPWDKAVWKAQKEVVINAAVQTKIVADPSLAILLLHNGKPASVEP